MLKKSNSQVNARPAPAAKPERNVYGMETVSRKMNYAEWQKEMLLLANNGKRKDRLTPTRVKSFVENSSDQLSVGESPLGKRQQLPELKLRNASHSKQGLPPKAGVPAAANQVSFSYFSSQSSTSVRQPKSSLVLPPASVV